MTPAPAGRRLAAMAVVLTVATAVVYFQVREFGFLAYDDHRYVDDNPDVAAGLSLDGVAWAATATHAANWHPVSWLSHMADVELFGMDAGRHHLVNAALHALNAVLLLFLLFRLTGSPWRSGFAAALFALHPLHVESVAWISERKDVLCALFCLLSLRAYAAYAARGGRGRYAGSLALFALALLSKPMAVTLPFLLLMVDWWPLGRTGTVPARRLLAEKVPFLLLSAVSGAVTYVAQGSGGAVNTLLLVPVKVRISNALVSYAGYLGKTVWPASLSAFYPHPWEAAGGVIPLRELASAILVLAGISVLSVRLRKTAPCIAFGWCWYLATLVPVIGIVAVGRQAMADRYTYLPLVGVFIAVAWGVPAALAGWRPARRLLVAGACAVLLALTAVSRQQVGYWRDDVTLFGHAAAIDPANAFAQNSVGAALLRQGRAAEAIPRFERVLAGKPSSYTVDALNNLGVALTDLGMFDKAADCFRRGLAIGWDAAKFRAGLAEVYVRQGKLDDAIGEMRAAVSIDPGNRGARRRLEAMESYRGRKPGQAPR